jgi:dihydrofolate synthase/folylpolyglutamate synthase
VIGNSILDRGARAISAVPYVPPVSPGSAGYIQTCHSGEPFHEGEDLSAATSAPQAVSRYPLLVMGKQILIESPLVGRHQLRNTALAIAAAEELNNQDFPITPGSIERGIRETRWPGRFQVIRGSGASPDIVMDVAHNPAGAWALRSTLSACYDDRTLTFVFGAMRDKAIGEIAEILFPLGQRVIITKADNPRSATHQEIRTAAVRSSIDLIDAPDVATALTKARTLTLPRGVIVVTGSIYIVGEAAREFGLHI